MKKNNRAAAVIIRDRKVLLFQRHKPGKDYFILPGGTVQLEESFEDACIREVKEETGLDVLSLRLVSRYITREKEENYYHTQVAPGEPVLGGGEAERQNPDDSYAFVWAEAEQLAKLNLLPGAARRICLEVLQNS